MATELINFKVDDGFLGEIDEIVKRKGFQSRTEFIRSALHQKVEEIKIKEAMIALTHLKGSSRKKITEDEYEKIRNVLHL